jgi:hypothetical protein
MFSLAGGDCSVVRRKGCRRCGQRSLKIGLMASGLEGQG